jgi:hypothetical protein
MSFSSISHRSKDNGGRRILIERRHYTYSDFFPERRATRFRRCGSDRRRYPNVVAVVIEKRKSFRQSHRDRMLQ